MSVLGQVNKDHDGQNPKEKGREPPKVKDATQINVGCLLNNLRFEILSPFLPFLGMLEIKP